MRFLGYIFSLWATFTVLLHTVVSHKHHSEEPLAEHVKEFVQANDLSDFLLLYIHADQPEGHLEEFVEGDDVPNFAPYPFIVNNTTTYKLSALLFSACKQVFHAPEFSFSEHSITNHLLRGPPEA